MQRTRLDVRPAVCCPPIVASAMDEVEAQTAASLFKALADPTRVRIVNLIAGAGRALCVCDLTPQVGLAQPTVSFHLKKLTAAGLLDRTQVGIWGYYSINPNAIDRLQTVFGPGGKP